MVWECGNILLKKTHIQMPLQDVFGNQQQLPISIFFQYVSLINFRIYICFVTIIFENELCSRTVFEILFGYFLFIKL